MWQLHCSAAASVSTRCPDSSIQYVGRSMYSPLPTQCQLHVAAAAAAAYDSAPGDDACGRTAGADVACLTLLLRPMSSRNRRKWNNPRRLGCDILRDRLRTVHGLMELDRRPWYLRYLRCRDAQTKWHCSRWVGFLLLEWARFSTASTISYSMSLRSVSPRNENATRDQYCI